MKLLQLLPFSLALGGAAFLTGCGGQKTQNPASSTATTTKTTTNNAAPANGNTITVLSPHNDQIKAEFKTAFEAKNPGLSVNWLDQGGTGAILSFVRNQFSARGKAKGIGADLFFGGGGETFSELEADGFLQPLGKDFTIPEKLNGVPLRGKNNTWVAAALSGFGILYNKGIAARDKLPIPQTWGDLASPALLDKIEMADPRQSGSAHTTFEIILQSNGWDKGWKILTAMAGNARRFAPGSSEPLQDVQNGEAIFCPAIDFYARTAIGRAGGDKLGYIEPKGQYVVTADPIGLLAGAQNSPGAKKFVEFVLSPAGQKLWFLPKGSAGGPKDNDLLRLPALPAVYKPIPKNALIQSDPYAAKNSAPYNADKAASRRSALDELIGSVLVDNHDAIKAAWAKNPSLDATGYVPLSEIEFAKAAAKWQDADFVKQTTAAWGEAAAKKFGG